MWISPDEYSCKYRISLPSLYPALRAGRVPGAKRIMGRLWRIWDDSPAGDNVQQSIPQQAT